MKEILSASSSVWSLDGDRERPPTALLLAYIIATCTRCQAASSLNHMTASLANRVERHSNAEKWVERTAVAVLFFFKRGHL